MIEEKALSLNYIKKLPLPGSDAGLRYMLRSEERIIPAEEGSGDKADGENEEKETIVKVICAYAWPEPLCWAKTDPQLIQKQDFPLTQEGKTAAVKWLNEIRSIVCPAG